MTAPPAAVAYEDAAPGTCLGEQQILVTQAEIDRFCALLGYDDPAYRADAPGGAIAPPSMGLTYGLRLGWTARAFPPGAIRMGDENTYGVAARPGDRLHTTLHVADRFMRKERKFLKYRMVTLNQAGEMVCTVAFTAIVP